MEFTEVMKEFVAYKERSATNNFILTQNYKNLEVNLVYRIRV